MSEQVIWGIHGGRYGDADTLFLKKGLIALGWEKMGDLGSLSPTRDAFKEAVERTYPDIKPGAIPNWAGQLYRFVHEMAIGEYVSYPSKRDRRVHLGRIAGGYEYGPKRDQSYPHQRKVEWLAEAPRTRFSQGALYEIGSAMSLFQVKNYGDELLRLLSPSAREVEPPEEDESVGFIYEEIRENTRDFILQRLARDLKGHGFARFVGHLLTLMGYRTRVAPEGPDGGVDIVAHRDELGFEPPIIKVQVKSSEGSISNSVVSSLYGNVDAGEFGLFVSLGSYTSPARNFANGKGNLRLLDGEEVVRLIETHYDQLDSKYKRLLPLKRVFVPQSSTDSE